jgi:hypothetical protein
VGELRVFVDELRSHREVARDLLGVLLAQRLQLVASRLVQVIRGDFFRHDRVVVTRAIIGLTVGSVAPCAAALREAAATTTRFGAAVIATLVSALATLVSALATLVAALATVAVTTRSSTITTLVAALTAITITTRSSTITTLVAALTLLVATFTAITVTTGSGTIATRRSTIATGRASAACRTGVLSTWPPGAVVPSVVIASRSALILVRHVLILSTLLLTQNGHPALGGHFV